MWQRSPARLCLCSRDGKLCYYGRLEYDFLSFFCALLPTSLSRYVFTVSSSCSFVCAAVISYYILSPSTLTWRQQPIIFAPRYATRIYVTKDTYASIYSDLCYKWTCTSTYAIYSYIYSTHTAVWYRWYEPAIPVAPVSFRGHITTKLHELKTVLDAGRGGRRA